LRFETPSAVKGEAQERVEEEKKKVRWRMLNKW
jgi:uncharacterized protein YjbJ (UPF0337 family)